LPQSRVLLNTLAYLSSSGGVRQLSSTHSRYVAVASLRAASSAEQPARNITERLWPKDTPQSAVLNSLQAPAASTRAERRDRIKAALEASAAQPIQVQQQALVTVVHLVLASECDWFTDVDLIKIGSTARWTWCHFGRTGTGSYVLTRLWTRFFRTWVQPRDPVSNTSVEQNV
jgi:hypothetical protein